jgi:hypothetical protein
MSNISITGAWCLTPTGARGECGKIPTIDCLFIGGFPYMSDVCNLGEDYLIPGIANNPQWFPVDTRYFNNGVWLNALRPECPKDENGDPLVIDGVTIKSKRYYMELTSETLPAKGACLCNYQNAYCSAENTSSAKVSQVVIEPEDTGGKVLKRPLPVMYQYIFTGVDGLHPNSLYDLTYTYGTDEYIVLPMTLPEQRLINQWQGNGVIIGVIVMKLTDHSRIFLGNVTYSGSDISTSFDTPTTGSWSGGGKTYEHSTGNTVQLEQNITVAVGSTYITDLTISGLTAGSIQVYISVERYDPVDISLPRKKIWTIQENSYTLTMNKTYKIDSTISNTGLQTKLIIRPSSDFDGTVSLTSIKRLKSTTPWQLGDIATLVDWMTIDTDTLVCWYKARPVYPEGTMTYDTMSGQQTVKYLDIGSGGTNIPCATEYLNWDTEEVFWTMDDTFLAPAVMERPCIDDPESILYDVILESRFPNPDCTGCLISYDVYPVEAGQVSEGCFGGTKYKILASDLTEEEAIDYIAIHESEFEAIAREDSSKYIIIGECRCDDVPPAVDVCFNCVSLDVIKVICESDYKACLANKKQTKLTSTKFDTEQEAQTYLTANYTLMQTSLSATCPGYYAVYIQSTQGEYPIPESAGCYWWNGSQSGPYLDYTTLGRDCVDGLGYQTLWDSTTLNYWRLHLAEFKTTYGRYTDFMVVSAAYFSVEEANTYKKGYKIECADPLPERTASCSVACWSGWTSPYRINSTERKPTTYRQYEDISCLSI